MEHRLANFASGRAEPIHPANIVNAIQDRLPPEISNVRFAFKIALSAVLLQRTYSGAGATSEGPMLHAGSLLEAEKQNLPTARHAAMKSRIDI
jgi:hypothetical protein